MRFHPPVGSVKIGAPSSTPIAYPVTRSPAVGIETPMPPAITGSMPMGANSVVPIPNAPTANAATGQLSFTPTLPPSKLPRPVGADPMTNARADSIERLVLNTRDLPSACAFYVDALGFSRRDFDDRVGVAILRLGGQSIELRDVGRGAPAYPEPRGAKDPWFQHFAIVVADMDAAYSRLEAHGATPISRGGPQRLPASTGGVTAFKFRDPEGHPLELSLLPNSTAWLRVAAADPGAVFLGIDHTALAVADLERSLAFYRDLGFKEGPRFLNTGPEQGRLDGLDDVVLDIGTMFAPGGGPHIELLHYRSPRPTVRADLGALSVASTVTQFAASEVAARDLADPDGHRLRFGG